MMIDDQGLIIMSMTRTPLMRIEKDIDTGRVNDIDYPEIRTISLG